MAKITRNPAQAAKDSYDLIIIGAGVYGSLIAFEACRRRLKTLLLEQSDFGGATTFNSLRTLHGGFRYLQSLDLPRFRESVGERRWFQRMFPDLVEPLSCLMPLYGMGVRRPSVLRIATLLNDMLSYNRNNGVLSEKHLPCGKTLTAEDTRKNFPLVDEQGLQGGALWYDVCMADSQIILTELLNWACKNGTTALNYVEARQLLKTESGIEAVLATDNETGESHEFKASIVVNAAGPWSREVALRFDRDEPDLFKSSLAWNMLIDRDALSESALAITPKKPGGHTYFLLPWKGKLLAGTGHKPWRDSVNGVKPSLDLIQEFIDDLNFAIPSLETTPDDILYLFPGLLPASQEGSATIAVREVILNHADHGGPTGLYSVSGVKFTTARLVAEKTLKTIFPEKKVDPVLTDTKLAPLSGKQNGHKIYDYNWIPSPDENAWKEALRSIIQEESVLHLEDLIFRRTSLWDNPARALEIAPAICELFPWDLSRSTKELESLKMKIARTQ